MNYTILVIDDDEPIHFMTKSLFGSEFSHLHARNAQEAIDILSKSRINLILSDIHMPGLSGLELLESLREDKEKKNIPVLIMTNLPTVEKEKKALDLGASDFVKKELFNTDKEKVLELIRMKIVTNVEVNDLEEGLAESKNKLVMKLMDSALKGSFDDTVDLLCTEMMKVLQSDFFGFWIVNEQQSTLLKLYGDKIPDRSEVDSLNGDPTFQHLLDSKEPYMVNHIYNEELGFFTDFSKDQKLSAEIAVPLCSVNEKSLLMNNMQIPKESGLFAVVLIKRSVLFSSSEFELISRLITQAGSILWRLYKKS